MSVSRRRLLGIAAASAAFGGLGQAFGQTGVAYRNEVEGYGPLKADPQGLFDLPEGFTYRIVSRFGDVMDDGFLTPSRLDGMGCFALGRGRVALVRNHELYPQDLERSPFGKDGALASKLDPSRVFDTIGGRAMGGGTTTLVWDLRRQQLVSHHLSLAGTILNCAGGVTPRGSWLTCEESTQNVGPMAAKAHGWVFEVPAKAKGLVDPQPIKGMGRFRHEAAVTDPKTGIVYLTEDMADGLFYRYLPNDPDRLLAGGRLQVMGLKDKSLDIRNWKEPAWAVGDWQEVVWIDIEDPESPGDDLRLRGHAKGAVRLARGEGLVFGKGEAFITCTSGGPANHSQILRYVPSAHEGKPGETQAPPRLQLFVEPKHPDLLSMADNISVAPWGHLFVCEDKGLGQNQLKAVTPEGRIYTFGRHAAPAPGGGPVNTELAGVCFSPDGSTLFLNIYAPGKTLAITGPWASLRV